MKDTLIYILKMIEIVKIMLPIIPSIISVFWILLHRHKEMQRSEKRMIKGYQLNLILLGFYFYPISEIIRTVIGLCVCSTILVNYRRIRKGRHFGGFGFPSMFFFNMTSFSDTSLLGSFIMIIYSAFYGLYIYGLFDVDQKEDKEENYLEKHEKRCFLLSAALFITCRIVLLIFTDSL